MLDSHIQVCAFSQVLSQLLAHLAYGVNPTDYIDPVAVDRIALNMADEWYKDVRGTPLDGNEVEQMTSLIDAASDMIASLKGLLTGDIVPIFINGRAFFADRKFVEDNYREPGMFAGSSLKAMESASLVMRCRPVDKAASERARKAANARWSKTKDKAVN